jgi:hypothetical protein
LEERPVPLLDHFRPPLSDRRPWDSFHTTWATSIADVLNGGVLPRGYIALEHIHAGAPTEIDVGTYSTAPSKAAADGGGTATLPRTVWLPASAPVVLPAAFPPSGTVEVVCTEGGRTLVAAIEIISPGNKDRDSKRRLFAAKCAAYLGRGVGLVILDVVTTRQGNLHNDLVRLLGLPPALEMESDASLYTVAYRPLRRDGQEQIDTWPFRLVLGAALPAVPLSLEADLCLRLDLEAAYTHACERRHFDEVLA